VLPYLLAVPQRGAEGLLDKNAVWFAVGDDVHEYLVVRHVRRQTRLRRRRARCPAAPGDLKRS
jgi:hypothetical protein